MKSVLLWSTPLFLLALIACSSDGSVPTQGGGGAGSGHGGASGHGETSAAGQPTGSSSTTTSGTSSSGSGTTSGTSSSTTTSSASSSTTTSSTSSSTTTSTSSGGEMPVLPFCQQVCASVADCAIPNVPAYDASHYACNSGVCAYTGCKSDAECSMIFQKPAVCGKFNGATIPSCSPACTSPDDCAIPNVPAYDASHYACDSGACVYTGCKSDAECSMILQKPATCQ